VTRGYDASRDARTPAVAWKLHASCNRPSRTSRAHVSFRRSAPLAAAALPRRVAARNQAKPAPTWRLAARGHGHRGRLRAGAHPVCLNMVERRKKFCPDFLHLTRPFPYLRKNMKMGRKRERTYSVRFCEIPFFSGLNPYLFRI
jgi:hypothetical protein